MARALVDRGHQVTILIPPYDNPAESGRVWTEHGVHLHAMALQRDDAWHKFVVPWRMVLRTRHLAPDVVHVFKPIGYSGLAGIYLRLLSRYPLVLDSDDWEGEGGWSDVNPYPTLWKRFFSWQERWLASHADAVTVASHTLQTQVWGFGVAPDRVFYLPNGPDPDLQDVLPIDPQQQRQVRTKLGVGDAPLALYLGHIPHGSDLDLVLDAMVRIADTLPGARLVIAGSGDGLWELQAHARRMGVADRVVLTGWVDPVEAPVYVAAADVLVNPYRDSLINRAKCAGKVVMGMAMGKAVITSRVGENQYYLEDGHSGLLTDPGDVDGLARALEAVLTDRAWAAELGENARRRIWAAFDWGSRMGLVERCYRLAIGHAKT
jgi:glycosyltransferase involved in cell wall biosynthesis